LQLRQFGDDSVFFSIYIFCSCNALRRITNKFAINIAIATWIAVRIAPMDEQLLTLAQLSTAADLEPRTIRNYIERGLLPGAQSRGRGAGYSAEHLDRLRVIQYLRRLRPEATLGAIRIQIQQLTPDQIQAFARGSISAAVLEGASAPSQYDDDDLGPDGDYDRDAEPTPAPVAEPIGSPAKLTGLQRLVQALRKASRFTVTKTTSKIDTWHRISVTEDIELSVREGFDQMQMAAFRELADVLRHLLNRPDAFPVDVDE
jgi:DNA-binding transcriptional MerR regulator